MKMFRTFLASFVLLALTTAFATNASAQTKYLYWDGSSMSPAGSAFTVATGTDAQLTTAGNWESSFVDNGPSCGEGTTKVCRIKIEVVSGTPSYTISDVINTLDDNYNDASSPHAFTSTSWTLAVSGGTIRITPEFKD